VLVRGAADGTAMSPPLVIEKGQIDQLIDTLREAIKAQ
jgi:adenosylmethionine-8-amino-7-oxononanoate aminotransferase